MLAGRVSIPLNSPLCYMFYVCVRHLCLRDLGVEQAYATCGHFDLEKIIHRDAVEITAVAGHES